MFIGTSDQFADFILRKELIASNVIEEYKVFRLAGDIVSILYWFNIEIDLWEDKNYIPVKPLQDTIEQHITAGNFNFWLGSPYLTANKNLAEINSLKEKGSEILTQSFRYVCVMPEEKSKELSSLLKKHPVAKILSM